jgi:hypothetical protein
MARIDFVSFELASLSDDPSNARGFQAALTYSRGSRCPACGEPLVRDWIQGVTDARLLRERPELGSSRVVHRAFDGIFACSGTFEGLPGWLDALEVSGLEVRRGRRALERFLGRSGDR